MLLWPTPCESSSRLPRQQYSNRKCQNDTAVALSFLSGVFGNAGYPQLGREHPSWNHGATDSLIAPRQTRRFPGSNYESSPSNRSAARVEYCVASVCWPAKHKIQIGKPQERDVLGEAGYRQRGVMRRGGTEPNFFTRSASFPKISASFSRSQIRRFSSRR